jgi:hypothetical protein
MVNQPKTSIDATHGDWLLSFKRGSHKSETNLNSNIFSISRQLIIVLVGTSFVSPRDVSAKTSNLYLGFGSIAYPERVVEMPWFRLSEKIAVADHNTPLGCSQTNT